MGIYTLFVVICVLSGISTAAEYCIYTHYSNDEDFWWEKNLCQYGCCGDEPHQTCCHGDNKATRIWVTVGLVVGGISLVCAIITCVCCCVIRKKRRGDAQPTKAVPTDPVPVNMVTVSMEPEPTS